MRAPAVRCRCSCCMGCLSSLYYTGVSALAQWRKFTGHMAPLHSVLFQLTLLALLAGNITSGVVNYRRMLDARAHPVSSLQVKYMASPPVVVALTAFTKFLPSLSNSSFPCIHCSYLPSGNAGDCGPCARKVLVDPGGAYATVLLGALDDSQSTSSNSNSGGADFLLSDLSAFSAGHCITGSIFTLRSWAADMEPLNSNAAFVEWATASAAAAGLNDILPAYREFITCKPLAVPLQQRSGTNSTQAQLVSDVYVEITPQFAAVQDAEQHTVYSITSLLAITAVEQRFEDAPPAVASAATAAAAAAFPTAGGAAPRQSLQRMHMAARLRSREGSSSDSRGVSVTPASFRLDISLPSLVSVQFETQTVAYSWADLFAAAASNFNLSLTVLAFLFPWRQMFTPTHRDFTLAPLTSRCTQQQQEVQQPFADGAAHSDADADTEPNGDAPVELGKAHPHSRTDSAAQPATHARSGQLHERLLA